MKILNRYCIFTIEHDGAVYERIVNGKIISWKIYSQNPTAFQAKSDLPDDQIPIMENLYEQMYYYSRRNR